MNDDRFYGYCSFSVSDRTISDIMYAVVLTRAKIIAVHQLGLHRFTRKQNSGNNVNIVVELGSDQVERFEELSGVELKTGEEFQGKMKLNSDGSENEN